MNTTTKWVIGGAAALVIVGGGLIASGALGGPSDKELIQVALKDAIDASKEGRPGGVLDFISRKFEVNGQQYGTRDIAKTIKDIKPNVEVQHQEPLITGERAMITSPVKLSVSLPPVAMNLSTVQMHFEREMGTKWLIVPAKKWRLTKVDIPDEVVEEVKSQFGGGSEL